MQMNKVENFLCPLCIPPFVQLHMISNKLTIARKDLKHIQYMKVM